MSEVGRRSAGYPPTPLRPNIKMGVRYSPPLLSPHSWWRSRGEEGGGRRRRIRGGGGGGRGGGQEVEVEGEIEVEREEEEEEV